MTTGDGTAIDARFVIDCSGRTCKIARRLTDRQSDQKMVSAFSFLDQVDTGIEATRAVMIEARPNGWWYSALTPSNRLVICFFSDAALLPPNLRRDTEVWETLVKSAPYTWRRVTTAGFEVAGVPDIMDAGSRYLTCFANAEKSWAAAGDAAAVFDPLSSHGLTTALWSGRKAALAANAALDNDHQPIHQYVEALTEGVNHYRQELKTFYWREHRFPNEPFWRDRQKGP